MTVEKHYIMGNIIYHYTSVESLLGILSSTSKENPYLTFWATEASCMNDPEEKKLGIAVLEHFYEEIENELSIPKEIRISAFRNSKLLEYAPIQQPPVYLISFSQEDDSLPMWEMYAKQGNGVNLGFDLEKIDSLEKKYLASLSKVYYRPDNWPSLVNDLKEIYTKVRADIVDMATELVSRKKIIEQLKEEYVSVMTYSELVNQISWKIKHEAYEYENEIRLAIPEVHRVQFRSKNGFIIPYVELNIPVDALKSITFGPTVDKNLLSFPLIKLLESKHIDISKIEFLNSKVPYRV